MKRKLKMDSKVQSSDETSDEVGHEEDDKGLDTESSKESMTVTLTDPQVLDCPICFDPLSSPVFQCENGHIFCESCCWEIEDICPTCCSIIGNNRCRAIEKVLESVTVMCKHKTYGCTISMSYSQKSSHEKYCFDAPFLCPISDCPFVGSVFQLNEHFRDLHKISAVEIQFDKVSHLTLNINDKLLVLQEIYQDYTFILNNCSEKLGYAVSVCCIGPERMRNFFSYSLAKPETAGTPLRFHNYVDCIKNGADNPPSVAFLLFPSTSFGSSGQLKLDLCIWKSCLPPPELI